jgi:hypothetical protein
LSGCPNVLGKKQYINDKIVRKEKTACKSLLNKYNKKGILFTESPETGLEEP